MPLSFVGLVVYMTVFVLTYRSRSERSTSDRFLRLIISLSALIATLLTLYSKAVLHGFCSLCLVSNFCFLVLFACEMGIYHMRDATREDDYKPYIFTLALCTYAVICISIYRTYAGGIKPVLDFQELQKTPTSDLLAAPLLTMHRQQGSSDYVAFVDLQCPHCQAFLARAIPHRLTMSTSFGVRFFIDPHNPDSESISQITAQAFTQGKGWDFLLKACREGDMSHDDYASLAHRLSIKKPCPEALRLVERDRQFTNRIQLTMVPTMIAIDRRSNTKTLVANPED